ncbi:hypothetical protein PanWU01x14_242180 [Parasponia andersonii]|uniref:Uncharacterized protein n=1 Tax=Parasponia andersonii TaxID=3476 RepID=A0A2P5BG26_PARAD|nr:hypothetical protein PanWU01x14_242180 [Parasponia andersonii]
MITFQGIAVRNPKEASIMWGPQNIAYDRRNFDFGILTQYLYYAKILTTKFVAHGIQGAREASLSRKFCPLWVDFWRHLFDFDDFCYIQIVIWRYVEK